MRGDERRCAAGSRQTTRSIALASLRDEGQTCPGILPESLARVVAKLYSYARYSKSYGFVSWHGTGGGLRNFLSAGSRLEGGDALRSRGCLPTASAS